MTVVLVKHDFFWLFAQSNFVDIHGRVSIMQFGEAYPKLFSECLDSDSGQQIQGILGLLGFLKFSSFQTTPAFYWTETEDSTEALFENSDSLSVASFGKKNNLSASALLNFCSR